MLSINTYNYNVLAWGKFTNIDFISRNQLRQIIGTKHQETFIKYYGEVALAADCEQQSGYRGINTQRKCTNVQTK